jgi:serine/threonine protein kinase
MKDNIVINELGQLILTDFNLSKLMIDRENERSHTFFGTPDYIAPEVLRG